MDNILVSINILVLYNIKAYSTFVLHNILCILAHLVFVNIQTF